MNKNDALNIIDAKAGMLCAASDEIWGLAELSLQEYGSEKLYEITKQIIEENIEKGNIKR